MRKKIFASLVLAMIMSCLLMSFNFFVSAKVFDPYENEEGLSLTVTYNDGTLNLTATDGDYQYQYWIRKKVETGYGDGVKEEQFIWQIIGDGFSTDNIANVAIVYEEGENEYDLTDTYLDEGRFNVIVRIKENIANGKVIDEIYTAITPEEAGKPVIESVEVNGKAFYGDYVVVDKSDVEITIKGVNADAYSLYYGESLIKESNEATFALDLEEYATGLHVITAMVSNENGTDKKDISLYVVNEFVAEKTPYIDRLETSQDGSVATFKMFLLNADRSQIGALDIDKFVYSLVSGSYNLSTSDIFDNDYINIHTSGEGEEEVLDYVEFTVDYGVGNYGIYQTIGKISAVDSTGYEDKIIKYYEGYARSAEVYQNAESDGYDAEEGTYTTGEAIVLTANGSITDATGTIKYAFYREDASGWVMIRDYKSIVEAPSFSWNPMKAGIYNIQTRIKDSQAGSYEKAVTKTYKVEDQVLSGTISIEVYDCITGDEANTYVAGNPYKIKAVYQGSEDVLYMFTLSSRNLGTVYLNNFTTSPYYIFVPNRPDDFVITARVINVSSFGYMDKSKSIELNVKIPFEYNFYTEEGEIVSKLSLFTNDPYLKVNNQPEEITVTLKKFDNIADTELPIENLQWSIEGGAAQIIENGTSVTVKAVSGITGGTTLRATAGDKTIELPVESWIKITQKEQLDRIGLATWDLRAAEDNDELERVLGGWYMLGGDIDYNNDYLIPIATNANGRNGSGYNATNNLSEGMAGATSRYTHHSYTMFQILNEYYKAGGPNDNAENRLLQGTHRSINRQIAIYYNDYTYVSGNNPTYFGLNFQGKAFTGILEGNGYSIKNAKLIEDIAAYQFTNAAPAPATNVFGYCGTQFIGYNDGIVRNISFDNLRYTDSSLGDKFDKLNISQVAGYNVYSKVSITSWYNASNAQGYLCTEFQARAGLIQVNNGTVENIRVTFTKDYRLHIYSTGMGVRVNNGSVNNLVMIHDGGAIVGTDDYYFTSDNANGSLSNCFALILLGVDIQSAELWHNGGEATNCNKVASVEELISAVAADPALIEGFDDDVWAYNPEAADSTVITLKKGNYYSFPA